MDRKTKRRMEELRDKAIKAAKNKDYDGTGWDVSRLQAAYLIEKRIALRKGDPEPVYDPVFDSRRMQALREVMQRAMDKEYSDTEELEFREERLHLAGARRYLLPG